MTDTCCSASLIPIPLVWWPPHGYCYATHKKCKGRVFAMRYFLSVSHLSIENDRHLLFGIVNTDSTRLVTAPWILLCNAQEMQRKGLCNAILLERVTFKHRECHTCCSASLIPIRPSKAWLILSPWRCLSAGTTHAGAIRRRYHTCCSASLIPIRPSKAWLILSPWRCLSAGTTHAGAIRRRYVTIDFRGVIPSNQLPTHNNTSCMFAKAQTLFITQAQLGADM